MVVDARVLLPFRKAAGGHGPDPGVAISAGMDFQGHGGQIQRLHAAGMIHVTMRDDHVLDVSQREADRR